MIDERTDRHGGTRRRPPLRHGPSSPASLRWLGFVPLVVQRKLRITSRVVGGNETSVAIVQIDQNGAYAVNSWEVQ